MNILVSLSSNIVSQGIYNLVVKKGHKGVVAADKASIPKGFVPDVILVDVASADRGILTGYQDSKVLLIDTGVDKDRIVKIFLSHRLSGVLSTDTDLPLFDKALQVVAEGQIWVDNNILKAFLHEGSPPPSPFKENGVTGREKEIIDLVCRGWSNREIAASLSLSEHTVKAHLNRIFRKCNAPSRSKLITLMMRPRQQAP